MKSVWTGTLGFGMVVIPVKLGTAASDNRLPLHEVRRSDGSRINYRRFAAADGEEVPYSEIRKGYEAGDGTVVLLEDADFELAYGQKNRAAKITGFIPAGTLPRLAHDQSYYVQPEPNGEQAYELLAAALRRSGKAAVVSFAMRQREANAMLYATDDGYLVLERLRWAADVKRPDFAAPSGKVTEEQVEQAQNLIGLSTGEFSWDAAADESAQRLAEVVQAKISTGQAVGTPAAPGTGAPANLEDMLRASVEAARAAQAPVRKTRARRPKAEAA